MAEQGCLKHVRKSRGWQGWDVFRANRIMSYTQFQVWILSMSLPGQAIAKSVLEPSSPKHVENLCLCCSWEEILAMSTFS
jgi:hypothetical protein